MTLSFHCLKEWIISNKLWRLPRYLILSQNKLIHHQIGVFEWEGNGHHRNWLCQLPWSIHFWIGLQFSSNGYLVISSLEFECQRKLFWLHLTFWHLLLIAEAPLILRWWVLMKLSSTALQVELFFQDLSLFPWVGLIYPRRRPQMAYSRNHPRYLPWLTPLYSYPSWHFRPHSELP